MMGSMGFELTKQIERHLIGDQIAWFTTVSPSGWPSPRPVWFVWDGSAITIYSLNTGAKQRHIAANDKVSLHFDSGPGGDVPLHCPGVQAVDGDRGTVPDEPDGPR